VNYFSPSSKLYVEILTPKMNLFGNRAVADVIS
jgi:hypothetical protein